MLVADGRFDYLETGSLISIKKNVKGILIPSEEDSVEMFPLDFEEFLWAMGDEMLMPYIKKQFITLKPMGDFHRKAMDYFRKYLVIGGMPQAVNTYVESRDFDKVDAVKRQILKLYRNDIRKYADNYETKVTAIFDEIPEQLSKHEKKFRLASLDEEARMLVENIVAQMLKSSGHRLFFYSSSDVNAENRMEIDFLIQKENVTGRHNISPAYRKGPVFCTAPLRNRVPYSRRPCSVPGEKV